MNNKLIKCDDCGGQVSRRAATCPHCGAPQTATVLIASHISDQGHLLFLENASSGSTYYRRAEI